MTEQSFTYDAFISYRHTERDKRVVDAIQKALENYRAPCDGAYIKKGEKIRRLFTDRSELPLSADLGATIRTAVEQSRFLVVIASPEYMESRWCMEELKTFLQCNGQSTERILFVRVGGEPDCVTDILSAAGVGVEKDSFSEPLYIDACAPDIRESVKIVKREYLRLAAILIGCGYDQMYQRHRRARRRKALMAVSVALALAIAVGLVIGSEIGRRKKEECYRDMDASIAAAHELIHNEDAAEALSVMRAVYERYGQKAEYAEYLSEKLSGAALRASYIPAYSAFAEEKLPAELCGSSVSSDGRYVIAYDIDRLREEGQMHIFLFDEYLNRISEYVLPVGEWKDELVMGSVFSQLRVDYLEEENAFEIELCEDDTRYAEQVLGERRRYSADGQLISSLKLTADEHGRTTEKVRETYEALYSANGRPVCMSAGGVYAVMTDEEGGYDAFGERDEPYWLVYLPEESDYVEVAGVTYRASDMHSIEEISITPDDRYIVAREERGIYNDVATVFEAGAVGEGVRLDMGSRRIEQMIYRFDEELKEACFLFVMSIPGEIGKSALAECRIADGKLIGCEMYEGEYIYEIMQTAGGIVYILTDTELRAIAAENLCLPARMAGAEKDVPVRIDPTENDLVENKAAFSLNSTGGIRSASFGGFTIDPEVSRVHHLSPVSFSGMDVGVGVSGAGEEVDFFSSHFVHPYLNAQDGVFGLIDYKDTGKTEVFRLYDFYGVMDMMLACGK